MSSLKIDGWEITPTTGVGHGPNFSQITCYVVVGPRVRTETRVDLAGLRDILPEPVYAQFKAAMSLAHTHPSFQKKIEGIATFTRNTPEQVYLLWRRYSREFQDADQSALIWEFAQWYHRELGVERIPLQDFLRELEQQI